MGEQSAREFRRTITREVSLRYLLYLPPDYAESGAPWPLVLFLHGAGERGTDLDRVKMHGLPKLIAAGRHFPFVVASPQWPEEDTFWDTDALGALLDEIGEQIRIDPDRVYVTGLSMGGYGTWALATAQPERFAAIAPICGGGRPKRADRIAHIPAWVFHGAKDEVVPIEASRGMVEALEALGADVRFTVYPEAGHDSFTETYDNPEFYDWLLAQRRTVRPAAGPFAGEDRRPTG